MLTKISSFEFFFRVILNLLNVKIENLLTILSLKSVFINGPFDAHWSEEKNLF